MVSLGSASNARGLLTSLVLVLTMQISSPAAQKSIAPPDGDLAYAESLIRDTRFADAEAALRIYLQKHPQSASAMYDLGKVLHYENRPKESLAMYTAAAAITPPAMEDLRIVALDYVLLEDYSDAVHWFGRALEGAPRNAELWYDLGRTRMMQLDFAAAEAAFERCLKLSPRMIKAKNNLGVTYEAENRSAEALEAYQEAIAWQQDSPHRSEQPLLNYGKLLITQDRSGEAVTPLEEAVKLAPNDPKCHEQLARALSRSGKNQSDRAQQEMLEAIRLDPTNARLHFQLGLMYREAGKSALAKEQMDLSRQLYGTSGTDSNK